MPVEVPRTVTGAALHRLLLRPLLDVPQLGPSKEPTRLLDHPQGIPCQRRQDGGARGMPRVRRRQAVLPQRRAARAVLTLARRRLSG